MVFCTVYIFARLHSFCTSHSNCRESILFRVIHVCLSVVMLLVKEHPCLFTFLPTMNIHLENSNLYTYILAYVHSPATYVGLYMCVRKRLDVNSIHCFSHYRKIFVGGLSWQTSEGMHKIIYHRRSTDAHSIHTRIPHTPGCCDG